MHCTADLRGSTATNLWCVATIPAQPAQHQSGGISWPALSPLSSASDRVGPLALQVRQVLEQEPHFCRLPGDKWGLAAFQPLRWGFAGNYRHDLARAGLCPSLCGDSRLIYVAVLSLAQWLSRPLQLGCLHNGYRRHH